MKAGGKEDVMDALAYFLQIMFSFINNFFNVITTIKLIFLTQIKI